MISGYIAAIVTPFSDGKVDIESFKKYLSFLADSKISGVVVCGSTGESLSLSMQEKIELIKAAHRVIGGKIKLFAGVIDAATHNCLDFIKKTEEIVDGFLCICPFYIKPSQNQIYEHFKTISDATKRNIILYNNPGRVGTSIDFSTLKKLTSQKNIVAVKECTSDLSVFSTWRTALKEDFAFLSGNDDTAAAALSMGAAGVISVTANIAPELCGTMFSAFQQNNLERFAVVRDALEPLHKLMFAEPSPGPVKYALSKLGLMKEELRMPLSPISSTLKVKIDKVMRELNLETV
jgi:4-hydroxy-tetrahydrodipicolinate synthase